MSVCNLFRTPKSGYFAFLVVALVFLGATTYPFRFALNHGSLQSGAAVFPRPGILKSRTPATWIASLEQDGGLKIEIDVEPFNGYQTGPARILTLSADHYRRNLTIGQEGHDLHIRVRRSVDTPNGDPAFIVPNIFLDPGLHTIRLLFQTQVLRVWVDHKLQLLTPLPAAALAQWDPSFHLALGNEMTLERPWLGRISKAQINARSQSINLLTSARVERPRVMSRLKQRAMASTFEPVDALLNTVLLVPLGFATAWLLTLGHPARAVIIWMPVTLSVEFMQVFIPSRFPSLFDIAANLLGVFLGAHLASLFSPRAPIAVIRR